MTVRTSFRLAIFGFAGYGGYTLWKRYGNRFRPPAEVTVRSNDPTAELPVPRQP